jgi:uncharacterized GH25 family protein
MNRLYSFWLAILSSVLVVSLASAHDSWVQTNTNLIRSGDAVHVDLMLGNHGNDHRDFKLAGKIDPAGTVLEVIAPAGNRYDLRPGLIDLGYAPKEGFHSTKFAATQAGMYTLAHMSDRVVNHGRPIRSIKSAKAHFVVSTSLDNPSTDNPGFEKPLGHPLELIAVSNPVTPMGPGQDLDLQVLFKDKPLADARVSIIPRGETLSQDFDERFERWTDTEGRASFTPTTGNYYLVVVHHTADDERGADYEGTKYSATLTVLVPDICPCCGE